LWLISLNIIQQLFSPALHYNGCPQLVCYRCGNPNVMLLVMPIKSSELKLKPRERNKEKERRKRVRERADHVLFIVAPSEIWTPGAPILVVSRHLTSQGSECFHLFSLSSSVHQGLHSFFPPRFQDSPFTACNK